MPIKPKTHKEKIGTGIFDIPLQHLCIPQCRHPFHLVNVFCSTRLLFFCFVLFLETLTSKRKTQSVCCYCCSWGHFPLPSLLCPPSRYYWAFCNSCFHGNVNQVILRKEEGEERHGEGVRKLVANSLSMQEVQGVHTSLIHVWVATTERALSQVKIMWEQDFHDD